MDGYKRFRRRAAEVWARRLSEPVEIPGASGTVQGLPGDWLVIEGIGPTVVVPDAVFRKEYETPDGQRPGSGLFDLKIPKP